MTRALSRRNYHCWLHHTKPRFINLINSYLAFIYAQSHHRINRKCFTVSTSRCVSWFILFLSLWSWLNCNWYWYVKWFCFDSTQLNFKFWDFLFNHFIFLLNFLNHIFLFIIHSSKFINLSILLIQLLLFLIKILF